MTRRDFIAATGLAATAALAGCATPPSAAAEDGHIMTVTGPIRPDELGRTLIHEHVVVDFIGAAKTTPARYDPELAFETALPHFHKLREHGVKSLVECTPRFIGRNVTLLRRLSQASGVQIVTNTGWYAAVDHKFLPPEAEGETAEQIAARWLAEWQDGIEQTGIRPGFLKLGTGGRLLPPVDAKLVQAAAHVHRATGLTIAIHTGDGAAALDEIRLLREEGVGPSALIWVHAMNDPGPVQLEAAKLGVWASLDGYSLAPHNVLRFVNFVVAHREAGTLNRVLLSHDDGWAVDGTAATGNRLTLFGNGNKAPYEALFTKLLPDLRAKGFTEADFDLLLVTNPREALTIRRRPTPMTAPAQPRSQIHPLDEFYVRNGRPLLEFVPVAGAEMPEPYRTLLVHERDMTRTLERFHQGVIHLRVLSSHHEGDAYWRESVLQLDGSDQPVEYGAIKIHLNRFPEPWRTQILEERRPLGGILNASGIRYLSRPTAYLRFVPDEFITCALHFQGSPLLFGRQNTLRNSQGEVLAEIIEILPPATRAA